jgi:hypothetical protein
MNKSLDAALQTLKDMRKDVGTGAKDHYSNLSKSLRQARSDSGKLGRRLQRDLQKGASRTASAARGKSTGTRPTTGRSTTRRTTTRRATTRRATTRRSTSGRSSSRRSS